MFHYYTHWIREKTIGGFLAFSGVYSNVTLVWNCLINVILFAWGVRFVTLENHYSLAFHIAKPVIYFAEQSKLLVSLWNTTLGWNGIILSCVILELSSIEKLVNLFISKKIFHLKLTFFEKNNDRFYVSDELTRWLEIQIWCQIFRENFIALNSFHATSFFLYPWKHQKTISFLMFSGGIDRDQRYDIG